MTHVIIVEARFYTDVADALLEGATKALQKAEASFDIVSVPGALEIPLAMKMIIESKKYSFDGIIALGCVIQGETSHYDIVCEESARGLYQLALDYTLPIGNGILTCDTWDQAMARALATKKNKGGFAAEACLRLIELKQQVGA